MSLPESPKELRNNTFSGERDNLKIKKQSRKQEHDIAKLIGGKRNPLSGSDYRAKADVKSDKFLIEAKMTEKASLSVKAEWLEKITMEAMAQGRLPALSIRLNFDNRLVEHDWYLVPASVFCEKFCD